MQFEPLALDARCTRNLLIVRLVDGRRISVPPAWFPRFRQPTPAQRRHWRLIGAGVGVRWEDVDEDISIESLLALK